MIIERCTSERFEDWVRLRQALWPDDRLEDHRRYAASTLHRPDETGLPSPATSVEVSLPCRGDLAPGLCQQMQHIPGGVSRGVLQGIEDVRLVP
jgi:hypothetical protein